MLPDSVDGASFGVLAAPVTRLWSSARTRSASGKNRSAEFGTRSTSSRSSTENDSSAVMPGSSFRSGFGHDTTTG